MGGNSEFLSLATAFISQISSLLYLCNFLISVTTFAFPFLLSIEFSVLSLLWPSFRSKEREREREAKEVASLFVVSLFLPPLSTF